VIGSARWETMLYLLQELALAAGGLRFHVLQSDASSSLITFSITMPEDRTGQVVVARERGNLGEWTRTQIRPQVTYGYVLGQGLGTARQVVEGGDAAASTRYGRRIEAAIDRRDTANGDELAQALATSLQDGGEQSAVDYVPIDSDTFEWGVDYDLGDRVTVVVDGEQLDEIVREVELSLGAGSHDPVVKPIISTPGDAADDPSARQLNSLSRRTSNLERNSDTQLPLFQQVAVGDIKLTARASADPGWLVCDGAAVSRTTYHGLFGVIGTTYGAGDGVATFNLPDLRDRAPVGASLTHPLASSFGAASVNLTHDHSGAPHSHSHSHTSAPHSHSHTHTGAAHTHSHSHTGAAHTHSHSHTSAAHSHSHGHTSAAHSHSHSHSGAPHTHSHSHSSSGLTFVGTASSTGTESADNGLGNNGGVNTPAVGHTHTYTPAGSIGGTTFADATAASFSGNTGTDATSTTPANTGADATSTTPADTGTDATAASFSAQTGTDTTPATFSANTGTDATSTTPANTGTDATAASYSGNTGSALTTVSVVQPSLALTFQIFTGV
jgi:microcystin-dependent protein